MEVLFERSDAAPPAFFEERSFIASAAEIAVRLLHTICGVKAISWVLKPKH